MNQAVSKQATDSAPWYRIVRSEQYDRPCVEILDEDAAVYEELVGICRYDGAIYNDGEGECFVVALRPDIGPELWTEESLKGSLNRRRKVDESPDPVDESPDPVDEEAKSDDSEPDSVDNVVDEERAKRVNPLAEAALKTYEDASGEKKRAGPPTERQQRIDAFLNGDPIPYNPKDPEDRMTLTEAIHAKQAEHVIAAQRRLDREADELRVERKRIEQLSLELERKHAMVDKEIKARNEEREIARKMRAAWEMHDGSVFEKPGQFVVAELPKPKPGDAVMMRGGGPFMTVMSVEEFNREKLGGYQGLDIGRRFKAQCCWFDDAGRIDSTWLPIDMLDIRIRGPHHG